VTFHINLHVVTYYLILSLLDSVTVRICQVEILLSTCIIELMRKVDIRCYDVCIILIVVELDLVC
jgi:hypothetical protein